MYTLPIYLECRKGGLGGGEVGRTPLFLGGGVDLILFL